MKNEMVDKTSAMGIVLGLLAIVAVARFACVACADEVTMKNGQKWSGKITRETDTEVAIEMELKGGAKAGLTLQKADVEKIAYVKLPGEEYQERLAVVKAIDDTQKAAGAYVALARWARENKLFVEAWQCYDRAVNAAPGQSDSILVEKAEAAIAAGAMNVAENTVKAIAERNPKHPRLDDLGPQAKDCVRGNIEADLGAALKLYTTGEFPRALAKFIQITKVYDSEKLDLMSKACEEQTGGSSMSALMIDCRFRQRCGACKGNGTIPCANPNCDLGRVRVFDRPVETVMRGTNAGATYTTEYCEWCDGLGEKVCAKCGGTGQDFGRPTDYEKAAFVKVLCEMGGGILGDAAKMQQDTKSKDCDEEVRFQNALTMFLDLRRAGYYFDVAKKMAPMVNLQIFRQMNQLKEGMAQILYNGAIRKYIAAKALLPTVYGANDALLLGEQARAALMYVSQASATGASPLFGNVERELRNVEMFLDLCRAAKSRAENAQNVRVNPGAVKPASPSNPVSPVDAGAVMGGGH
jgi:tetratricopeptide (TPR) repeat protein